MHNSPIKHQLLSQIIKGWSWKGGIYLIKCTQTNKTYLGSTGNIMKRLKHHYHQLVKNQHHNQEMQADFNQWGEQSFVVGLIKLVPSHYSRKQLYLDEQDYLDVVKSFPVQYYNKSHKCETRLDKPRITEAIQSFIRKHIAPYTCLRWTCDTIEVEGQVKTVISYMFPDQITHYHTIIHS